MDWTEQRLAGMRDPYLRKRVPRERITEAWAGISGNMRLQQQLRAFQDRLRAMQAFKRAPHSSTTRQTGEPTDQHA